MNGFNKFERKVGRLLEAFPGARVASRALYRRLNGWIFADRDFSYALHPDVTIQRAHSGNEDAAGAGPWKARFFGYYFRSPWSRDGRWVLCHEIDASDHARLLAFDRTAGEVRSFAYSEAWNYQQGTMLQWVRASQDRLVAFNVKRDGGAGARLVEVRTGKKIAELSWPIQDTHPSRMEAVSLNYGRLDRAKPEYGYGLSDGSWAADRSMDDDGLWTVDLDSDKAKEIVTLDLLASHRRENSMERAYHYVNHAVFSPDGARVAFLHRWKNGKLHRSRLYVVSSSPGADPILLMEDGLVSHYHWLDAKTLIVWGRTEEHGDRYHIVDVESRTLHPLRIAGLGEWGDGHPSPSPKGDWVVTDSYPDRRGQRHLLALDMRRHEVVPLGRFASPVKFDGPTRCDLHPRWSPDGRKISIDSVHEGRRIQYILDVTRVVER